MTDTRRDKCRSQILLGEFPALSIEERNRLEKIDREARANAQKLGRSHAIAVGSAKTATGKRIGRVSA